MAKEPKKTKEVRPVSHQGKAYTKEERIEIINKICEGLMDGLSLRSICSASDMPNKVTVLRWLNDPEDELAPIIARAREFQADALDDDIQDITQRMLRGEIGANEARVAIWAIQWRAAKLKPKKYGDKQQLEHTGPGGGPVQMQVSQMTREELMKELEARGLPTNLLDN